jgi:hypothetical protein
MNSDAAVSADDPERLCVLQRHHTVLERAIEAESSRPLPDTIFISEMKRTKLRIKDQLERIAEKR